MRMKYVPPVPSQNKSQLAFDFRQITVRGLAERRISEIKSSFYTLWIRLRKIKNIVKVGKNTYEFLVDADYSKAFMRRMTEYGYNPMDDYNSLTPRETNPSDEVVNRIRNAAITRLARNIMSTKVNVVKNFYLGLCSEQGLTEDMNS